MPTLHTYTTRIGTTRYHKIGNGSRVMLAFHGFDQDHTFLDKYESSLANFTIYAFEAFFQGESRLNDKVSYPISSDNWQLFFEDLLKITANQKVHILGFSMGGRHAIQCFNTFPDKVLGLYLFAPDGFMINPFMKFFTQTMIGQSLMKWSVDHSKVSIKILHFLGFFILKQKVVEYYSSFWSTKENRYKVMNTWFYYAKTGVDHSHFKKGSKKNIFIFAGVKDSIVSFDRLKSKVAKFSNVTFFEVFSGHQSLLKKSIHKINDLDEPTINQNI